jgi:hypothetical protein
MDRGCIVAAGHAQEIFEDVRLDAAFGVRFERLKVGRPRAAAARLFVRVGGRCSLASSIVYSR